MCLKLQNDNNKSVKSMPPPIKKERKKKLCLTQTLDSGFSTII